MYKSRALGQAPAPAHNPERNKWQKMNQSRGGWIPCSLPQQVFCPVSLPSPPISQCRWLPLPKTGSDEGLFMLKGSFSFPLSPSARSKGIIWLSRFSLYLCGVFPLHDGRMDGWMMATYIIILYNNVWRQIWRLREFGHVDMLDKGCCMMLM